MQQRLSFLLVALIFLHLTAVCQNQKFVKNYLEPAAGGINVPSFKASLGIYSMQFGRFDHAIEHIPETPRFYLQSGSFPNLYTAQSAGINPFRNFNPYADWGIICQKEWQLEKVTGIPFRFRLGSVEYVDKLEAKTK